MAYPALWPSSTGWPGRWPGRHAPAQHHVSVSSHRWQHIGAWVEERRSSLVVGLEGGRRQRFGSVGGDMAGSDNLRAAGKGVRHNGWLWRRMRCHHLPNEAADLGKQRGSARRLDGLIFRLPAICAIEERRVRHGWCGRWSQRWSMARRRRSWSLTEVKGGGGFGQGVTRTREVGTPGLNPHMFMTWGRHPARPISVRHLVTGPMTDGLHVSAFSRFKIKPKND
jgi:hypothetical protein